MGKKSKRSRKNTKKSSSNNKCNIDRHSPATIPVPDNNDISEINENAVEFLNASASAAAASQGPSSDRTITPTFTSTPSAPAVSHSSSEEADDGNNEEVSALPPGLEASLSILTPSQQELVKMLCSPDMKQSHLFQHWPKSSAVHTPSGEATNKIKRRFVEQLESIDKAYPSGLAGYLSNAKELLEKSRKGLNPLQGWKPSIPKGECFEIGTKQYESVEKIGMKELGKVGFVLVAGGLGERLGYGDIKVSQSAVLECNLMMIAIMLMSFAPSYFPCVL